MNPPSRVSAGEQIRTNASYTCACVPCANVYAVSCREKTVTLSLVYMDLKKIVTLQSNDSDYVVKSKSKTFQ